VNLKKRVILIIALCAVAFGLLFGLARPRVATIVLTGIVTTDDVIVAPQVAGSVARLVVRQGQTVARGQLLAVVDPAELQADRAYYAHSAAGLGSQVNESVAALRYQERGTENQIRQAEANLAVARAQRAEAAANLEDARLAFSRQEVIFTNGAGTEQDRDHARTFRDAAKARLESLDRQVEAQRAALALAHANADQVAMRRDALAASRQQHDAARAQASKADVRLGYSELRAPIAGVVDVRAARQGEYVTPGQAVITLVDPDDLWVRIDVEETYIDRVRLGDTLTVRLPSGEERTGTIFFRGVDAGFATQRDVSRTKRDIRTFEVRLRVDNRDRRLALGMTSYVLFPVGR